MNKDKNEAYSTIDVFDSLPVNIQHNHKLLKAFCSWYLKDGGERWEPKQKDRMMVKRIVRDLASKYPDYKSPGFAKLPEIKEIQKAGNYSDKTIIKWIRQTGLFTRGAPIKKS